MAYEDIKKIIEQEVAGKVNSLVEAKFAKEREDALYNVPVVPFHIHNGIDSPDITSNLSSSQIKVNQGTGLGTANVGGVIFDHYASVGNVSTTETDLYSDTIVANSLGTSGTKIEAEYGGTFVSSATATRQIKIYFGGTNIFDTGALTLSLSSAWTAYVSIICVSSTVVRYMVSFTTEGAALSAYTAVGEVTGLTLSNTNILKITGTAAAVGAATNDIVAKMGTVLWYPAAS